MAAEPGEGDFCPCGGVYLPDAREGRFCAVCGDRSQELEIAVRTPDGAVLWVPMSAIARELVRELVRELSR